MSGSSWPSSTKAPSSSSTRSTARSARASRDPGRSRAATRVDLRRWHGPRPRARRRSPPRHAGGAFARTRGRGRACSAPRRRRVRPLIEHQALLDLHRRRAREILVRPHAPAADLLVTGEPRVRVAHHRSAIGLVGRSTAWTRAPPAVAVQPDDGSVPDPIVAAQHGLDVVGIDLLPIGQRIMSFFRPRRVRKPSARAHRCRRCGTSRRRRSRPPSPRDSANSRRSGSGRARVLRHPRRSARPPPGIGSPTVPIRFRSGARKADYRAHLGRAVALDGGDTHV